MEHKWRFHNRGVIWNTPMARWAGSEGDWMQKFVRVPHQKEDVIVSLMAMMRQPTAHWVNKTWRHSQQRAERS